MVMQNFKCFRDKEIEFSSDITTIMGRNGVGKTTIADAILFCLFGKNTLGQSDLEIFKTIEDGKVIPHLDHSVELTLLTKDGPNENGECWENHITLKRSIKEVWVKKRGLDDLVFKNNSVDYYICGEASTAADYKQYIASLISEDIFRAITNPTYFPSLKWQEQREFLTRMAGDIEIPAEGKEFKELLAQIESSKQDLISYRKHLSNQIKDIKKKLDIIPTRLEEQNKALPVKLDWEGMENLKEQKKAEIDEISEKIAGIKGGLGADVRREEIRNRIKEVSDLCMSIEQDCNNKYSEEYRAHLKRVNDASGLFGEALNNQKLMQQTIEADKRMIERCLETDYEAELQKLRDQWPSNKFSVDPDFGICPTCGQALPSDQYQDALTELRNKFNLQREAKIKSLNEQAAKVKKAQEDSANERKRLEEKLHSDEVALEAIKNDINNIFAEKAKIEKEVVKGVSERLAENPEYIEASKRKNDLQAELNSVTDSEEDKNLLNDLENRRKGLEEEISLILQNLATKTQYDRGMELISGINEEQKNLVNQLSELERKEDVAVRYQSLQYRALEDNVNKHFSLVRWRFYQTVNNGGDSFDEPYCECYVDGVPYHKGLNDAAKLNAGLDICNTLAKFYNSSAPIIIDQAECNLRILPTIGQQIRLQVYDSILSMV